MTTIPDLKALTEAVGGDRVDVESLTRGSQNFRANVVHGARSRIGPAFHRLPALWRG